MNNYYQKGQDYIAQKPAKSVCTTVKKRFVLVPCSFVQTFWRFCTTVCRVDTDTVETTIEVDIVYYSKGALAGQLAMTFE